jgi:hypothetical protein
MKVNSRSSADSTASGQTQPPDGANDRNRDAHRAAATSSVSPPTSAASAVVVQRRVQQPAVKASVNKAVPGDRSSAANVWEFERNEPARGVVSGHAGPAVGPASAAGAAGGHSAAGNSYQVSESYEPADDSKHARNNRPPSYLEPGQPAFGAANTSIPTAGTTASRGT